MSRHAPSFVADTSSSSGTGTITLANAAPDGFRTLADAGVAVGDTFPYTLRSKVADEVERGIGTYTGSHQFTRSPIDGSAGPLTAVTFTAGGLDFMVDVGAESLGSHIFGDGSDGDVTISGTVTLTRDMYYRNLTLAAGADLKPSCFRVHVANVLDLSAAPASAITVAGSNASGTTGGSAGGGGTSKTLGTGINGTGGSGSPGTGNGAAGSAGSAGVNGGRGGLSGSGGNSGGGQTGGAGAQANANAAFQNQNLTGPLGQYQLNSVTFTVPTGGGAGSRGGTGAGDGTNNGASPGAGGASGGTAWICARVINRGTNTTAGIITGAGGNGAGGSNGVAGTVGGGGGGSGGGGGFIGIVFGDLIGNSIANAIDVSGGSGGGGGNGISTGDGGDGGGSGESGYCYLWPVNGAPVITSPVAGSAGSANSGATGGAGAAANTSRAAL